MTFPILPGNGPTGYNLTRSLRFRASASAYLNKLIGAGGANTKHATSFWMKRGTISNAAYVVLYAAYIDANNYIYIWLNPSDKIGLYWVSSGSVVLNLQSTMVLRDPSSWYHVYFAQDTTQASAANRFRMWINGAEITSWSTNTNTTTQNSGTPFGANCYHNIGRDPSTSSNYFDGYLAEFNDIWQPSTIPPVTAFGSYNSTTGVWQPAKYTGTYGTNGFYLPFTDNSALTTSSNVGLGKDFSGNGNYWVTNNISITSGVTYDSMTDVPTLTSATAANFCVGNPLSLGSNASLSNANLSGTLTGSGGWSATICGLTSGKWYWEATPTANSGISMWVGFLSDVYTKNDNGWSYSTQTALYANDARNGNNASYGATWTTGDVIGVALDLSTSNGSVTFYKNGVSQGVMFSSLTSSARWRPLISSGGTGTTIAMNFGQRPFTYTPPSGFVALNAFNLPDSTIKQGNKVMDATLYTGNGSTQTITNAAGFKPDLVWGKNRSAGSTSNWLENSVTGAGQVLYSDQTSSEQNNSTYLPSINSNGFTVAGNTSYFNASGNNYVAWQWQAGQGTTSTNTAGSITSTVSVNSSAGFSIVTYTGNGSSSATVGHGLNVVPALVITKARSGAGEWMVKHQSLPTGQNLLLNQTLDAASSLTFSQGVIANLTSSSTFGFTSGSSGVNNANQNGVTYVAYCFAPIAGYSAFGSWQNNNSTDGTFIYCGFSPAVIILKNSDNVENWFFRDIARQTYNMVAPSNNWLQPNTSNAEGVNSVNTAEIDVLSNGFKIRTTNPAAGEISYGTRTYIYGAWAANPFKYALAK